MVNAHAEISDPSHPAYPIIAGQKEWMLDLFTDLVTDLDSHAVPAGSAGSAGSTQLARTLMLLHEGALVAHGLNIFPDPIGHARDQAQALLSRS